MPGVQAESTSQEISSSYEKSEGTLKPRDAELIIPNESVEGLSDEDWQDSLFGVAEVAARWGVSKSLARLVISQYKEDSPGEQFHDEHVIDVRGRMVRKAIRFTGEQVASMEVSNGFNQEPPEDCKSIPALAEFWGVSTTEVWRRINTYIENNPDETIARFKLEGRQRRAPHISPAQILEIDQLHKQQTLNHSEGYDSKALAARWQMSVAKVRKLSQAFRQSFPDETFHTKLNSDGRPMRKHQFIYSDSQVAAMEKEYQLVSKRDIDTYSIHEVADELGVDYRTASNAVHGYLARNPGVMAGERKVPGTVNKYETVLTHEQVQLLKSNRSSAPEGYMEAHALSERLGISHSEARRRIDQFCKQYPDEIVGSYRTGGASKPSKHLSPQQIATLTGGLKQHELSPDDAKSLRHWAEVWNVRYDTVARTMAKSFRKKHPDEPIYLGLGGIANKRVPFFTAGQAALMFAESRFTQSPPHGSKTLLELAKEWGVNHTNLYAWAHRLTAQYPEQKIMSYRVIGNKKPVKYLSSEQIELVEQFKDQNTDFREVKAANQIFREFEDFLGRVRDETEIMPLEFQQLVTLFGAERIVDILYNFHPDTRAIRPQQVSNLLSTYLGDFMSIKGQFNLDSLRNSTGLLLQPQFRSSLEQVIKNDCLRYLKDIEKEAGHISSMKDISAYFDNLYAKTSDFSTDDLKEVIQNTHAYFELLFENIHKPQRFKDELSNERRFPDINQRVNVQEIAFNKRMLIADEMGTGKTASAIMAKEILGVKQALVVLPSNVIETWQGYLQDYFKEGQNPSVLVVDAQTDIDQEMCNTFEYILISQERLNDVYAEKLIGLNYDMLIVDESHKLKNIADGIRAQALEALARNVKGSDQYLVMLSGTPVPNTVSDVAHILKMIYPEKFADVDNKALVNQIIDSDMLSLRGLLVPRMQMKALSDTVQMPAKQNETVNFELSTEEQDIYEILVEEDELTASEKLATLRKFVLNPELLDSTPNMTGSKLSEVSKALQADFEAKDKIVMFVNGYVEGILRGNQTILDKLGLKEGITVLTIDGHTSREDRISAQQRLGGDGKVLLVVSGQTADVGVDFSAAQGVYFYNEPWTIYDKQQQQSRVYRPGLKEDLTVKTFIASKTIEEGIHKYIGSKYKAIEKLLRGVPISDLEKNMLRKSEQKRQADLDVNPELAEYYFSAQDKMAKIYGYIKEIGETGFKGFLEQYGEDYASTYEDLAGSRSYQANVARINGSLLSNFINESGQRPSDIKILDLASGPEILKRHISDELSPRVLSMDINSSHFKSCVNTAAASMLAAPVKDESVDYVNVALAWHYTSFAPSRGVYERTQLLGEVNRVLKHGGMAVISLIHSLELNQVGSLKKTLDILGFEYVEKYSGVAQSTDKVKTQIITIRKKNAPQLNPSEVIGEIGPGGVKSLKFTKTTTSLKNTRKMVNNFKLGSNLVTINFNERDRLAYQEETTTIEAMESLSSRFGGIVNIPAKEIISRGFARVFNGKRYVLFKRLSAGEGSVVIK